jgi:hypothetical protein
LISLLIYRAPTLHTAGGNHRQKYYFDPVSATYLFQQ